MTAYAREAHAPDLNTLYRQAETWAVPAVDGAPCPSCEHPNLPGADECELCLASLTHEETSAAEVIGRIERSLYRDRIEKLAPAEPISVPETATVEAAIGTLRERRIGCLLVTDSEGRLSGIFTERDALVRVAVEEIDPARVAIRDVMTSDPETILPDHLLAHAFHLMMVHDLRHLPLVDEEGRPAGIVNSRDLIDYLASLVMD